LKASQKLETKDESYLGWGRGQRLKASRKSKVQAES